ncbi:MAG: hypothetical protein P4L76_04030 [Beijerinckiaceae bacterium]|nr:hypothetical protein [Beijerinckiaceae bacterium]
MSAANALIAQNPGVQELRREHAATMTLPMVGTQMAGDPSLLAYAHHGDTWRRCQYAACLAVKRGLVPPDLTGIDAEFHAPRTIVFIRADSSQAEIGRLVLPDHVPDQTAPPPRPLQKETAMPEIEIGGLGRMSHFSPSNEGEKGDTAKARKKQRTLISAPSNEGEKINTVAKAGKQPKPKKARDGRLDEAAIAAAEQRGFERGANAAWEAAQNYAGSILAGLMAAMALMTGARAVLIPDLSGPLPIVAKTNPIPEPGSPTPSSQRDPPVRRRRKARAESPAAGASAAGLLPRKHARKAPSP